MPVIDLQSVRDDTVAALASCDVCIIGSGPAGATIARELSGTGLRVTILESGGFTRERDIDVLNDVESVGYPRLADQWAVRNRIVGGSSHTWGGRCAPFDEIDLQRRPWVPDSGWPFSIQDISPYLDRSASHLGLAIGTGFSDDRFWAMAGRRSPRFAPRSTDLLPFFWQFSRDDDEGYPFEYMRFGRKLAERIGPNVTLVAHATVLRIDPVASGDAVRSVEVVAPDGRARTLAATTVVLCAGGIENARLLLASDTVTPDGLGNRHDVVGRFLMDHLRGPVGRFDPSRSGRLQGSFGRYNVRRHLFRAGLRLSPQVQQAERLLNTAVWLGEVVAEDDPWNAVRRIIRGRPHLPGDLRAIGANAGLLARGLKSYLVDRTGAPRKLDSLTLDCMCEQRPDRDSRVTLSDRRDRFGLRLPRVDWRVHDDEARSVRRTAFLAAQELSRMGFPPLDLDAWIRDGASFPDTFHDVAHPSGTTRIASNPRRGVVDAQCRVHGVRGLYVAGSSVFPTIGHCNPTQMIVALAVRLSDHLKADARRIARPAMESIASRDAVRARPAGATAAASLPCEVPARSLSIGIGIGLPGGS